MPNDVRCEKQFSSRRGKAHAASFPYMNEIEMGHGWEWEVGALLTDSLTETMRPRHTRQRTLPNPPTMRYVSRAPSSLTECEKMSRDDDSTSKERVEQDQKKEAEEKAEWQRRKGI